MEETRKSPEEILCLSFNQAETGGGWVEGIFWLRKDRDISSKVSKKPSWEVVEGGNFMDVYIYMYYYIFLYHPRWWFQWYVCCLHVDPCLGHDSIWLVFLNWVETTNVKYIYSHSVYIYHIITFISGESKSESPISLGRFGSFTMESTNQRGESCVRMLRVWLWDGHEVR